MRRLLLALALISTPALAADPAEPLPASPAQFTGTDWRFRDQAGAEIQISFLPQGKALLTFNRQDWVGTWSAQGTEVTITSPRGSARFTYEGDQVRGSSSLTGREAAIAVVEYRGKIDMDKQVYAQLLRFTPCDWINEAVRITARGGALSDWATNGKAFDMQGYGNAKRSESRNRLIVAEAGKGRSFGGIKGPYLTFHKLLADCPIRHDGKSYGLEGLVRTARDKDARAELVYSYFRLRGASGKLGQVEIVIYGDWHSRTPFAVLDIGTGDSAFPNFSSYAVRSSFPKGWQPFGVRPLAS